VNLDAGTIVLNGPTGSNIVDLALSHDVTTGSYNSRIADEGLPPGILGHDCVDCTMPTGTYTLSGIGGKDAGKFNASITIGSPISISGALPSTILRSEGLTIRWTGGNPSDVVRIMGTAGTSTNAGTSATVDQTEFLCTVAASAGGFTVPASVLLELPTADPYSLNLKARRFETGSLEVMSSAMPAAFTAPLADGGSVNGILAGWLGTGAVVRYR
jgi:hypothetical protein